MLVLLECENTLVGIFDTVIAIVFHCGKLPKVPFLPDPVFVINREDGS
jgi:hypothetical protein